MQTVAKWFKSKTRWLKLIIFTYDGGDLFDRLAQNKTDGIGNCLPIHNVFKYTANAKKKKK